MTAKFRTGGVQDSKLIYRFLQQIAEIDGMQLKLAPEKLLDILSNQHNINILICEQDDESVGMAIWEERFNALSGGLTMWLLELFIAESHREVGLGKALFLKLKEIAKNNGYTRIEWFVHINNVQAKAFYQKLGGIKTNHTERWRMDLSDNEIQTWL